MSISELNARVAQLNDASARNLASSPHRCNNAMAHAVCMHGVARLENGEKVCAAPRVYRGECEYSKSPV